jgi:hypothetical protein
MLNDGFEDRRLCCCEPKVQGALPRRSEDLRSDLLAHLRMIVRRRRRRTGIRPDDTFMLPRGRMSERLCLCYVVIGQSAD